MTRLRYDESAGDWQDGHGAVQVPRFEAIATMLERFGADGSVLDVGCGVAALRQWLPAESRYLGVEQSGAALKEGLRRDPSLAMVQEKAEKFDAAGELFDSIVFNEMLYYCANPVGLLRKFAGFLAPGGVIVCSIFQKPDEGSPKSRLLHWLDPRRPRSNIHCEKLLRDFMGRASWAILDEEEVPVPGDAPLSWHVWLATPDPRTDRLLRQAGQA